MDLKSGSVFWPIRDGTIAIYPRLDRDRACDVAIIGGGVTGALAADYLARAGASVVVLDRREICHGSTCASTGLLQYEIDTPLIELVEQVGLDHAQRAYRLTYQALDDFRTLAGELSDPSDLISRPSLYLATKEDDIPDFLAEQSARRKIGIEVEFLSGGELRRSFGIDRPGALWSTSAVEVDPYRLAFALMKRAGAHGAEIYANTEVTKYSPDDSGVTLQTDRGPAVRAKRVVFAMGYETPEFLDKNICQLKSTFAMTSEPIADFGPWRDRCLIWEAGDAYFYARTTSDGRAMIGGEDEDFVDPDKRDALIVKKCKKLVETFGRLLPEIPVIPHCRWAGTFAETKDGLPYIGVTRQFPLGYFALGYGGNGITFSLIAAGMIRDLFMGKANPDAEIFRFCR